MNPHNFSIYACEACGVLMVCGSIWLLRIGVINLSSAVKDAALTVELANKVKISTTYPALALFVIGLLFTALGIWFSKADIILPINRPLMIVGKIQGVDNPSLVTVTAEPDQYGSAISFGVNSDGQLDKILPDIKQLRLKIAASGYQPQPYETTLNIDDAVDEPRRRRLNVPGEVKFTKVETTTPIPGKVVPIPAGTNLAPFHAEAGTPIPAAGKTDPVPPDVNQH